MSLSPAGPSIRVVQATRSVVSESRPGQAGRVGIPCPLDDAVGDWSPRDRRTDTRRTAPDRRKVMTTPQRTHPTPTRLAALARGQLDKAEAAPLQRHLADCPA